MKRKILAALVLASFIVSMVIGPKAVNAQGVNELPIPGTMVNLSPTYAPVLMKGIKIHPENPFLFDFIIDSGSDSVIASLPAGRQGAAKQSFKEQSSTLIKYFLAAITIPEKDLWVNLSPYEKDRIVPDALGKTDMGRDMLAQDYILKQLTASLIYPEKGLGKIFWDKVYAQAQAQYGTSNIPLNTFNKVWIVADKADVFERNNTAYVIGAHLKVMLEEDYTALNKNIVIASTAKQSFSSNSKQIATSLTAPRNDMHHVTSKIIKEIILPAIEEEVNRGKNFAPLRQMFYSMILASWYKQALKDAVMTQVFGNQNKVNVGVNALDQAEKEKIYARYLQAYKKGVFNYIKEESVSSPNADSLKQSTPRKYFSGGNAFWLGPKVHAANTIYNIPAADSLRADGSMLSVRTALNPESLNKPIVTAGDDSADGAMLGFLKRKELLNGGTASLREVLSVKIVLQEIAKHENGLPLLDALDEFASDGRYSVGWIFEDLATIQGVNSILFNGSLTQENVTWKRLVMTNRTRDIIISSLEGNLREKKIRAAFKDGFDANQSTGTVGEITKRYRMWRTIKSAVVVGAIGLSVAASYHIVQIYRPDQLKIQVANGFKDNVDRLSRVRVEAILRYNSGNTNEVNKILQEVINIAADTKKSIEDTSSIIDLSKVKSELEEEETKAAYALLSIEIKNSINDRLQVVNDLNRLIEELIKIKAWDKVEDPLSKANSAVQLIEQNLELLEQDVPRLKRLIGLEMDARELREALEKLKIKIEQNNNEIKKHQGRDNASIADFNTDKSMTASSQEDLKKQLIERLKISLTSGKTILLIEDNKPFQNQLRILLNENFPGYPVTIIDTEDDAEKILTTNVLNVGFVITDNSYYRNNEDRQKKATTQIGGSLAKKWQVTIPVLLMSGGSMSSEHVANIPFSNKEDVGTVLEKISQTLGFTKKDDNSMLSVLTYDQAVGILENIEKFTLNPVPMNANVKARQDRANVRQVISFIKQLEKIITNNPAKGKSWVNDGETYFKIAGVRRVEYIFMNSQESIGRWIDSLDVILDMHGNRLSRLVAQTKLNPQTRAHLITREFKPQVSVLILDEEIFNKRNPQKADQMMKVTPGGIDLDRAKMDMKVSKDQAMGGVNIAFDPAMVERIKQNGFDGFEFNILSITPVTSVLPLLGLRKEELGRVGGSLTG